MTEADTPHTGSASDDGARNAGPIDMVVGPGPDTDNGAFGALLARLRAKAGLSRADAAKMLDLSAEYLRLIELGKRTPALGQMRGILDAYGAEGEIETTMPGRDRPDLAVIDPRGGEPVFVDFTSRIREARGSLREAQGSLAQLQAIERRTTRSLAQLQAREREMQRSLAGLQARERATRARASGTRPLDYLSELGSVVARLAQVDAETLRRVRDFLDHLETEPGVAGESRE